MSTLAFAILNSIWFFTQPSSLLWLAVAAGLGLSPSRRFSRAGRRLAVVGTAALLVFGLSPIANWLVIPLEARFPVPAVAAGETRFAGIIVLGGAEDGRISFARGQLALNEAGERITEGLRLAHRLPAARLVFTGGAGAVTREARPGGDAVAAFWADAGVAPARILVEGRSLTTYENAQFSRDLLHPQPGQRWLLVTSAAHMPRGMGLFRRAGFDVTAYPVDFRTKGPADALRPFGGIAHGLRRLDDGVREWSSLVAHRLLGRTDALLPAP